MSFLSALAVISRWIHVVTACIFVGGVFFMRIILPAALVGLEPEPRKAAFLRARRLFKRVIHTGILLFLLSGGFNLVRAMPMYRVGAHEPIMQALIGIHMTLAIVVFVIAIYLLMGSEPPASHKTWLMLNLILLLLAIFAASSLKFVREKATLAVPSSPSH